MNYLKLSDGLLDDSLDWTGHFVLAAHKNAGDECGIPVDDTARWESLESLEALQKAKLLKEKKIELKFIHSWIKVECRYHQPIRHCEDVLFWKALDGQSVQFKIRRLLSKLKTKTILIYLSWGILVGLQRWTDMANSWIQSQPLVWLVRHCLTSMDELPPPNPLDKLVVGRDMFRKLIEFD